MTSSSSLASWANALLAIPATKQSAIPDAPASNDKRDVVQRRITESVSRDIFPTPFFGLAQRKRADPDENKILPTHRADKVR